jgi:cell wall assembly regulator SMI1
VDANARVAQGVSVLHRLEAKPMGWPALLATGLVYLALLLVPVAALAYMGLLAAIAAPTASSADNEVWRTVEAKRVEWRKATKAMDYRALVANLNATEEAKPLPGPASAESLQAVEARLHHAIPADLREFYGVADGLPGKSIASIAGLRALTQADVVNADGVGRAITIYPANGEPIEIKAAEAIHWWYLGGMDSTLFYLPEPDARLPGVRVVDAWPEDPTTHATLREYLEMLRVGDEETAYYEAQFAAREARAGKRLANADVPKLMSEWQEPGLAQSLMGVGWPGPAESGALDAAERRIGARLPADLRRALETHDGFPPLSLLPAAELDTLGRQAGRVEAPSKRIDSKAMADCIIVAAMKPPARGGRDKLFPSLLWCPGRGDESWVAMETEKPYASFRQWLLARTVRVAAAG